MTLIYAKFDADLINISKVTSRKTNWPRFFGLLGRDDGSPRFGRQTVKMEVRTGAIVKKIPEFYSVGGARSQNSIFRVLGYLRVRLSGAQPT